MTFPLKSAAKKLPPSLYATALTPLPGTGLFDTNFSLFSSM